MEKYKYLKVFFNGLPVGTLAKTPDNLVAFEYDGDWLNNGFSISPFSLPLVKKFLYRNLIRLTVYSAFLMILCRTAGEGCLLTDSC